MITPAIWVPCPECGKPKRKRSIRCKACFKRLSLRRLPCHCYSKSGAVHCQMIRYCTTGVKAMLKYGPCKCKCHQSPPREQPIEWRRRRKMVKA